jgi:LysR family glycine cleavage system transcriptional activator
LAVKEQLTPARRKRSASSAPTDALRRLPLNSLRVFVAVAEHLHFTRAASSLGVTVSAASMQVRLLEQYLGVTLFERRGQRIELSAAGAALVPKVKAGLAALQSAIEETRAAKGEGPLRISMLGSFLTQWLMPRLHRFEASNPHIELRIENTTSLVDFSQSPVDAAIRSGTGNWPGLYAEKLIEEWLVPVCHPSLLKKLGPVNEPMDLKRYRLLHSAAEPWSIWLLGVPHDDLSPRLSVEDSAAIVRAAEAGAGLALARWSLAVADVRSGRLAVASKRIIPHAVTYWFVCPPKHRTVPKVAAFHAWLRGEAAQDAGGP